jgi:hypothetical protein
MADGPGNAPPPNEKARGETVLNDPQAMARDWITIWQSELAALATDRELQEHWVRLVAMWADAASLAARFLPGGDDVSCQFGGPTGAGSAAAAGTAAAVAAPDARDAAIQRLAERVEELERRLAQLGGADKS